MRRKHGMDMEKGKQRKMKRNQENVKGKGERMYEN